MTRIDIDLLRYGSRGAVYRVTYDSRMLIAESRVPACDAARGAAGREFSRTRLCERPAFSTHQNTIITRHTAPELCSGMSAWLGNGHPMGVAVDPHVWSGRSWSICAATYRRWTATWRSVIFGLRTVVRVHVFLR